MIVEITASKLTPFVKKKVKCLFHQKSLIKLKKEDLSFGASGDLASRIYNSK